MLDVGGPVVLALLLGRRLHRTPWMTPPQPRTTSLNATIAVTTSIVGVVVAATIRSYDASVVAPGLGAAIAVVYRTLNHLQPRPDTPRVAPA